MLSVARSMERLQCFSNVSSLGQRWRVEHPIPGRAAAHPPGGVSVAARATASMVIAARAAP